ncbi:MAG: hypothetical protein QXJ56_02155 [Ignisphaera sp.]|uniref:Uncharacterized protein n=1 Tax=Ignisphaera aggregans TaxID=334771 RepID=A0A7J3JRI5_9CREN
MDITQCGSMGMFRGSQIKVDKKYMRHYTTDTWNYTEFLDRNVKVVPFEAFTALYKLYNNDIKSFIETHIDVHICTPIISLCREHGPRIKCLIYTSDKYLEIYSECFDVELLSSIIFGDLSNLFTFEIGYRDGRRFKRAIIPKKLILQLAPEISKWNRNNSESEFFTTPLKTFGNMIRYVLEKGNEVTELIFHIPCLDDKAIDLLYEMVKSLANKSRIYILTTPPTLDNAKRCQSNYKGTLIAYLEAYELLSRYNVTICNIDTMHVGLIVNRMHYVVSYEYSYRDDIDVSIVKDKSYIEAMAQSFLRECFCSTSLIKDDYRYGHIYKIE